MAETTFRPTMTDLGDRSAPSSLASWSWTWSSSWSFGGQAAAPVQAAPAPVAAPVAPPAPAYVPASFVAAPATPATPDLNGRVVSFSQANLGQAVGAASGADCYDFAAGALQNAGAKAQWQLGTNGPNSGHYAWGTEVYQTSLTGGYGNFGSLSQVKPGDVVQFDGYHQVDANGYWADAPHHTAVVSSVDVAGGKLNVYQQNWNGQQTVQQGQFNLSAMTSGVVTVYRPVAQ